MKVTTKKVVTIEYTLKDDTGSVIDSSEGHGPLAFIHGIGQIIQGLEKALEGMSSGEQFKVSIPPAEAYGHRDESLAKTVNKSNFGGAENIEVGMQFEASNGDEVVLVTITDIEGDNVTVDANHPLAGMTLHFSGKIVGVRDPSKEELEHGHVHGEGGHHH